MLPGLFDRLAAWAASYAPLPRFTLLEGMLATARRKRATAGLEAALWRRYDPRWPADGELPSAAVLSGLGEPTVLHATPVHLTVGMQDVILTSPGEVTPADMAQIDDLLNTHFGGNGLRHHLDPLGNGYLAFDDALEVRTTPPSQAAGGGIFEHLPRGPDAPRLHQLGNELQMLLHAAPFNVAREQRRQPTINGLWLWGAGHGGNEPAPPHELLVSDLPFAHACAAAAGQRRIAVPATFDIAALGGADSVLIVHDGLRRAAEEDDLHGWHEALVRLEQQWLQPLRTALARGEIRQLVLDPCHGRRYHLSRAGRWKFWRRPKPLAAVS